MKRCWLIMRRKKCAILASRISIVRRTMPGQFYQCDDDNIALEVGLK